MMKYKAQLMDETALRRAMMRLSYEIVEKSERIEDVVLLGIRSRGMPLAEMIAENIRKNAGLTLPLAELDIRPYRDDTEEASPQRQVSLPFDVTGREVVLVDDVLFTGRTVRAAIDALFSVGRPAKIRLAVLIDRGHRELPIRPDYVGKNVPTSRREDVKVHMHAKDGVCNVELYEEE